MEMGRIVKQLIVAKDLLIVAEGRDKPSMKNSKNTRIRNGTKRSVGVRGHEEQG